MKESQRPLGVLKSAGEKRQQGMLTGKEPCGVLQGLNIVLHGTGAQRVEVRIHRVVAAGQIGEVAHGIQFAHLRQAGRIGS